MKNGKPITDFNYTERHKSLRIHTQRSACLTLCGSFKINDSNGENAIYYDAVYSNWVVSISILFKRCFVNYKKEKMEFFGGITTRISSMMILIVI
jgi:hypothetical protein